MSGQPPDESAAEQPTLNERRREAAPSTGHHDIDPQLTSELGADTPPAGHLPLDRIASYELLEEVGRGGMGVVYKARDGRLGRVVALKMILGGRLARPDDLQRFQTEALAAARLQHPGLVAVYEAATHEGQPYFSMEFVSGSSLAQRVADGPLPGRLAASYLERTARAVHYAHEHGVLHRDLKPANVLLDGSGQPKVTDFGLAKMFLTDSGQTRTGAVIGTPSYMSPEQAAARKDLGPASDVYSLGAILYEMLTGKPPFRGETALATITMVAEQEPVAPRLLNPKVEPDLETITLKCLEKDERRRYASAAELADDLRRYLDNEPIAARRLGRLGRAWKWCRRKPAAAALLAVSAAASVVLVVGLVAFSVWQSQRAEEERALREAAETQRAAAEKANRLAETRYAGINHLLYLAQMRQVRQAWDEGDLTRAEGLLARWVPSAARPADLRGWEWHLLNRICGGRFTLPGHKGRASAVAFRPDGRHLVTAGGEPALQGTITIWDIATGRAVRTLTGHRSSVTGVAYSPDGKVIASSGFDRTVRLWDAETGRELAVLGPVPAQAVAAVLASGGPLAMAPAWFAARDLAGHRAEVTGVAFTPDGLALASAGGDGIIKVWDVSDPILAPFRGPMATLRGHSQSVTAVAFAADATLASASLDRTVRLWDIGTGKPTRVLAGHAAEVTSLAFDKAGTRLASAGGRGPRAGELAVWDVPTGAVLAERVGLSDRVLGIAFAADGRLAAVTGDGYVRVWADPARGEATVFRGDSQVLYAVAFGADGRLATAGRSGRVRLWNSGAGLESYSLRGPPLTDWVALSPDGKRLACAGRERGRPGEIQFWDVETGKLLARYDGPVGGVHAAALSPDGTRLAAAGEDGTVWLFDLRRADRRPVLLGGKTGHTEEVVALVFSPDGKFLASAGRDETIRLWNVETGELVRVLKGHGNKVLALAFSPDGKWLASGSFDQTARLWEVATGAAHVLRGHAGATMAVAFSPDGRFLATGGSDRAIVLWDLKTREEYRRLDGSAGPILALAFHPHEQRLVSAGQDRVARLWDLMTGQELLELEGAGGPLTSLSFSKDGKRLACGGYDTPVRVWQGP